RRWEPRSLAMGLAPRGRDQGRRVFQTPSAERAPRADGRGCSTVRDEQPDVRRGLEALTIAVRENPGLPLRAADHLDAAFLERVHEQEGPLAGREDRLAVDPLADVTDDAAPSPHPQLASTDRARDGELHPDARVRVDPATVPGCAPLERGNHRDRVRAAREAL